MSGHEQPVTVRELAELMKTLLRDSIHQQVENWQERQVPGESLGTLLEPTEDVSRRVRARRFREAMTGVETLLMGERELNYQSVLELVLHNIGGSLRALGLLSPEGGLAAGPELDFRQSGSYPAMIAPVRYIPLPAVHNAMVSLGFARYFAPEASLYLTEYRVWQPRLLRGPAYEARGYGLFAWDRLERGEMVVLPLHPLPGQARATSSELVMLGQRRSLLGRLFDAAPRMEAHVIRLTAREFTYLLRALLMDYERHHATHQREVADQDQLGALLWDFLSRSD